MAFHNSNLTLELTDEFNTHNNCIAGTSIFLLSIIGLTSNSYVVFVISRRPSMQNAFGRLSQNQAIADLCSSLIYFFCYAPMVYFDIKLMQELSVSRWFGFFHLVIYDAGNLVHFAASVNRVVVIFFPLSYSRRFGMKTASVINCVAWIVAAVPGFFAHIYPGCPLVYNPDAWEYNFLDESDNCQFVGLYYVLGKDFVIITLNVTLDFATFTRARFLRKELRTSLASNAVKMRKRDEINFVTQALLQGIVFAAELITYFFVAPYVENRWIKFALTQVMFQLTETLDGIITICFNKEFRQSVKMIRFKVSSLATRSQF